MNNTSIFRGRLKPLVGSGVVLIAVLCITFGVMRAISLLGSNHQNPLLPASFVLMVLCPFVSVDLLTLAPVLSWNASAGATGYRVIRGTIVELQLGTLGDCLQDGIVTLLYDDPQTPNPGEVYTYLIQGESPCGLGSLGYTGSGLERDGASISACP